MLSCCSLTLIVYVIPSTHQDMIKDKHLFDTSEYDSEHLLYSTENKKVLGKMKDKTHGIPIQ